MKLSRSTYWTAAYAAAMVAGTVTAQAQAPAPTPAPVAPPAEVAVPTPEPTPAPEVMAEPAPVTSMEPMAPTEQTAEEDHEMAESGLALAMFADTYYNFDWNLPGQDMLFYNGNRTHSAYVNDSGFGLAFLGLDASYSSGTIGATASLRYGTAANRLIGQYGNGLTLENVWQAYVTWTPVEKLTLDLGQFATLYGAEVGESWLNVNYTRGALYFYMQPFWHTGMRVAYQATDELTVKAILTNGVNNGLASVPYNGLPSRGPDIGLQLAYAGESVSAYLGYYGSPIESDGNNWSHFVDLVVVGSFGDATVIFNGDVGVNNPAEVGGVDPKNQTYFGLSLAGAYKLSDEFGVALRGEFLKAPSAYGAEFGKSLITATLTLDYKPADGIVIRLDNRLEAADSDMFANGDSSLAPLDPTDPFSDLGLTGGTGTYISSTLGVVVHTN